jgi:hypothetical protein
MGNVNEEDDIVLVTIRDEMERGLMFGMIRAQKWCWWWWKRNQPTQRPNLASIYFEAGVIPATVCFRPHKDNGT